MIVVDPGFLITCSILSILFVLVIPSLMQTAFVTWQKSKAQELKVKLVSFSMLLVAEFALLLVFVVALLFLKNMVVRIWEFLV